VRIRSFLATPFLLLALLLIPSLASAQDAILDVKANVDGALVFLDGELLGETPLLEIVSAGSHTLRVEREAFTAFEDIVQLEADTTLELSIKLIRQSPGLEVRVDVDTAKVFLDGKQVGSGTRVLVDPAPAGVHELRVTAPEFNDWTGKVTLRPGQLTPVEVALRGSLGLLAVKSSPPARVLVDGRDHGQTPVKVDPIQPGAHGLRIVAEGMSTVLQSIVVEPGKTATVEVKLVPEGGTVEVKPSVSNARVFLNGVELGVGKVTSGPLKPGMYSLRVTAPGHADFIKPVQVEADQKSSVAARLQAFDYEGGNLAGGAPRPVTKHPAFWVGIGAGAAAIAGGIIAGVAVANAQPTALEPRPGRTAPTGATTFTLP
jgi:hypothetical protein